MEFQLNEDFVKENNLTEEQVKAVAGFVTTDFLPNIQKQWDGKANENAEGIINGVIKSTQEKFNIELERQKGEKHADYLERLSEIVFENKKSKIEKLEQDYQEKLKEFDGGKATKAELEKVKSDYDEALKKLANYNELEEKASKYEEANQTLSTLKLEVAFNGIKPRFSDDVNKYEAKAKWEEFKKEVLANYTIELVDNVPMAIDKENHYKTVKLEDLLSKSDEIQELIKGRQQGGTGAKPVDLKTVDGVPFKVPVGADAKTRSKIITEHLTSKGLDKLSKEYADQFAELNKKILQGQTQAA